jgi:O-antigen/teichoic acid export membrane protein
MSIVESTTETATPSVPDQSGLQPDRVLGVFGRSTLWLWLDRGGLRIGTMLAGLLLVRYLGPTDFGVYTTALAYGGLLGAVLDFGLSLRAFREVGVQREEGRKITAVYLAITLVAFIPQLAFLIVALALGHWYLACIATGFILLNSDTTSDFCRNILTAELRAKATLPGSALSAMGMITVVAAVIWLHASVLFLLIGLAVRSFVVVSLRLWQVRAHWPSWDCFKPAKMRAILALSWPYYTYTLTQIGYQRISVVCLGLIATPTDVGIFGAAITIAYIYPLWTDAVYDAVLPLLTRLFEYRRLEELIEFRQRVLDLLLVVSVPVVVLLSAFAPEICRLLGSHYADSTLVLRIVAYRSIISVLDTFLGQAFLTAIGRVRERRDAQVRAFVVLALLTLLLGHYWGPIGAAVALLIADLSLFFQYLPICRAAGLGIKWPALGPSLAAGASMMLIAMYLPQVNWVVRIAPSLLVYALVMVLLARDRVLHAGNTVWQCFGGRA